MSLRRLRHRLTRLRPARMVPVGSALVLLAAASGQSAPALVRVASLPDPAPSSAASSSWSTADVVTASVIGPVPTARRLRLEPRPAATDRVTPNGTPLWRISDTAAHDLPVVARRAYERAAATMARRDPGCGLHWTLLAGIGRVESDHGRYGDAELRSDGVARPRILGLPLNGVGPVAAIRDSDNGRLDGDRTWDRAVGPMQFIPTTWATMAADGDGDGRRDPHDIDDTAYAAANYLCRAGDLRGLTTRRAAVFSYNHSTYYVDLVLAFARGYETGVFDIPPPPAPEPEPRVRARAERPDAPVRARTRSAGARPARPTAPTATKAPAPKPTTKPTPKPTSKPKPTTTKPTSKPKPTKPTTTTTPKPKPPPTGPETIIGTLSGQGDFWSLSWSGGSRVLDLTAIGGLDAIATADLDGVDGPKSYRDELTGLAGRKVTMQLRRGTGVVLKIYGPA